MPTFTDQTGRAIELEDTPTRIVSLVPSQTELICDLGLEKNLIGVTRFCVHPEHLKSSKVVVGGTKKIKPYILTELKPDLIVANKEENTRKDIEELSKAFPVYVSDIATSRDCYAFAKDVGDICGKSYEADLLIHRLKFCYSEIANSWMGSDPKRVLYLIWKSPYMAAGTDTYISEMMSLCGLVNVLNDTGDRGLRYPSLTVEDIKQLNPELILFSSEPYPFNPDQIRELEQESGIAGKYVDGELFSWYGSRILHSLDEMKRLIHEIH